MVGTYITVNNYGPECICTHMPVLQKCLHGLLRPVGSLPGLNLSSDVFQEIQHSVMRLLVFQLDSFIFGCDLDVC